MQITNKFGKKYISEVKRHLKCAGKPRRGYLNVLQNELYNFEQSSPDADYRDYTATFGLPEDVAQSCLDELSRTERAAYWLPFAAVLGAAVVSAFVFLSVLLISQLQDRDGYMVQSGPCIVSSSDACEHYD